MGDSASMGRAGGLRTALLLGLMVLAVPAWAFETLHDSDLRRIGERIFANECGGRAAALLSWNAGEDFASLGIGHFIWYPAGGSGPYEESFVDLIDFFRRRGVALPPLVRGDPVPPCPWPDRGAFLAAAESPNAKALRAFLQRTVAHQTRFMARRLRAALPRILDSVPASRRLHVQRQYRRVARTPAGIYALVDYVNFKGEGGGGFGADRRAGMGPFPGAGPNGSPWQRREPPGGVFPCRRGRIDPPRRGGSSAGGSRPVAGRLAGPGSGLRSAGLIHSAVFSKHQTQKAKTPGEPS